MIKDVKGYEHLYQINDNGVVFRNNKQLKPYENNNGYLYATLCKNGKPKHIYVHRLVAEAFLPLIDGKNHINHIDGNKKNNNVNNLEWCNRSENMKHAYRLGLAHVVNKKLSDVDLCIIKELKGKTSAVQLAKQFNVSFQLIYKIWSS